MYLSKPFRLIKNLGIKIYLILLVVFALTSCSENEPDQVTRNIRVIVQAEVDGKIVEGSAVMGLRWEPCCNGGVQTKSNTEAVILRLNEEHSIYVLDAYFSIRTGKPQKSYWDTYVTSVLGIKRTVKFSDFSLIRKASGKYAVSAASSWTNAMPVMVSFEDETRRETMFQVTPENFTLNFGANTKFIGLWFEFIDDPITELIEAKLPLMFKRTVNASYWEKYPLKNEDGELINPEHFEFPQIFGKSVFKKKDF